MGLFFTAYFVTIIVFFAIDMLWLGIIAKNIYQKHIGHLLKKNVNWIAAFTFYFLFIAGLVFFVILPALDRDAVTYALLVGGLFGLLTYATYDLTNLATLKDWPITITIIDLIWGTALGAATSTIAFLIVRLIM